jgi:hypothetical protein
VSRTAFDGSMVKSRQTDEGPSVAELGRSVRSMLDESCSLANSAPDPQPPLDQALRRCPLSIALQSLRSTRHTGSRGRLIFLKAEDTNTAENPTLSRENAAKFLAYLLPLLRYYKSS